MSHFYTDVDHFALLPAIILALFGCAIFLFDSLLEARSRRWQLCLILPGLAITGWQLWKQGQVGTFTAFHGALTIDPFSLFFNWLFLLTAVLIALISYRYLEIEKEHQGEYYGLVLMAQSGAYFLATGTELITLFIGLETMSLSFYVLVGFLREKRRSNEAALKYLLLGAFLVLIAVHGDDIDDLNGFARRHPAYAIPMVVFLLSLAGLPPTAGFLGKYYIFLALIESGRYALALVGAVYVAISLFYYFRLVRAMFLLPATLSVPALPTSLGLRLALGATGLITLGAGIYPEPFLQLAARSLLK